LPTDLMNTIDPRPFLRLLVALAALSAVAAPRARAQFETRGSAVAQQDPYAIAVGDFNHYGKLDLAVVSDCCGLSILLGNGDGTFQAPVQYAVGEEPFSVVAADFNHDGNLDLAVANGLSEYVSILMGNGDGTFQPATQSPPVSYPDFVTVGDFNGDGNLDLLALSYSNPCKCISVFFGNGDGTFQDPVITEPSFSVLTVGVGDFNGDGKLDLATAGNVGAQRYVNILLGNGDGTFTQGATYTGETSPSSIAVADLNGDHKLDFAVANYLSSTISVWMGNGDGTFQPAVDYDTSFPLWVVADELNGNGKIDLAAANVNGGVSVFAGNGDGTFQPGAFYPGGTWGTFVAVGDFNGDRKPDLVITDHVSDDVFVLLNTGVVSYSPTTPLNFGKQAVGTTSAAQTVTLTNTGTTELKIPSIKASAEFSVTTSCRSTLIPDANCAITVAFSPTKQGAQQGTITIIDNASSKPQVIELLGTGT
jgi:FG-GAP-like repeat/Abnormal spindle-like microcephaly-assoc'd, ASPM-SPD-2-Hydin/FG-GAP repeat